MGIKFFFKWLKKTYPSHIKTVSTHGHGPSLPAIDHFLVDMNGIIHYCCQKVYKYGAFAEKKQEEEPEVIDIFDDDELGDEKQHEPAKRMRPAPSVQRVVDEVTFYLHKVVQFVKPRQSVFLAVDGVAPLSKQFQQRSRRYRSEHDTFNSNNITPGTVFLHTLCTMLHRWIMRKIDRDWNHLTVLYSSEKAPGEGEHKLVKWVREFGKPTESYMMHGMDADLVMLALATHFPHFHILRENSFRPEKEFFHICVESIRLTLINSILGDLSPYPDKIHLNDFIVMIFLTGNDFLPMIPTIELLEGGAEYLFEWYRITLKEAGPLTTDANAIRPEALAQFFQNLSVHEKHFLEIKRGQAGRFPDKLLNAHTSISLVNTVELSARDEYDPEVNTNLWSLDFAAYRRAYYAHKLGIDVDDEKAMKQVCTAYLDGIQWVLAYYLQGVPNWKWAYPYLYAPFLSDLAVHAKQLDRPAYVRGRDHGPFSPLLQLMCVLPPKSADLLPAALVPVFEKIGERGYPNQFEVDVDGKFNDWEGIVQLPVLPWMEIDKLYRVLAKSLTDEEMMRNRMGRTFEYRYKQKPTPHALSF